MGNEAKFESWVQTAIKFFVLANTGGAAVTLSFVATRSNAGICAKSLALVALACFVFGVIFAGITIMGQLTAAYRKLLTKAIPSAVEVAIQKSWVTRTFDKAEPITGRLMVWAFGLFVLGCLVGLTGLAFSI